MRLKHLLLTTGLLLTPSLSAASGLDSQSGDSPPIISSTAQVAGDNSEAIERRTREYSAQLDAEMPADEEQFNAARLADHKKILDADIDRLKAEVEIACYETKAAKTAKINLKIELTCAAEELKKRQDVLVFYKHELSQRKNTVTDLENELTRLTSNTNRLALLIGDTIKYARFLTPYVKAVSAPIIFAGAVNEALSANSEGSKKASLIRRVSAIALATNALIDVYTKLEDPSYGMKERLQAIQSELSAAEINLKKAIEQDSTYRQNNESAQEKVTALERKLSEAQAAHAMHEPNCMELRIAYEDQQKKLRMLERDLQASR